MQLLTYERKDRLRTAKKNVKTGCILCRYSYSTKDAETSSLTFPSIEAVFSSTVLHHKKRLATDIPVPSRDVTDQTLPGGK
jgi:hypothetical protein